MKQGVAYRSWVFDCDGVLLDSNGVKTEAFRRVGQRFGAGAAGRLVAHHHALGGVSRYVKLEHLFSTILGRVEYRDDLERALDEFHERVVDGLRGCPEMPGLRELLDGLGEGTRRIVVSGGDQDEVRHALEARGLASCFDVVFGSPRDKDEILADEIAAGRLPGPALMVGDSRYDHEVACRHGLDFVFVHAFTEFEGWREYFATRPARVVRTLAELP